MSVETEIGPVEILYTVREDGVIICSVKGHELAAIGPVPFSQEDTCVLINRLIQEKRELKSALENLCYELAVGSYERIEESTKKARELLDKHKG